MRLVQLVAAAFILVGSHGVVAGEMLTLKAFGRPLHRSVQEGVSQYGAFVVDVITVSAFNCNGTSTNTARILVQNTSGGTAAEGSYVNAGFIAAAEIINAAKLEYVLETRGTLTYSASSGGCNIFDYYIHVQ